MDWRHGEHFLFVRYFFNYAYRVRAVLVGLLLLLVAGGVTISQVEGIALDKAIYFAFITGLSIGYGDITPETAWGRVLSVAIGLIGMVFVGITVAVATRALADSTRRELESKP
jgi:hypothetical protein